MSVAHHLQPILFAGNFGCRHRLAGRVGAHDDVPLPRHSHGHRFDKNVETINLRTFLFGQDTWQRVAARAHNSRSRKELRAIAGESAIGEWSLQRSAASPGLDAGAHAGFPDDERLHASATVIDTAFPISSRNGALT